ncbi:hypothetical protein ABNC90_15615 [Paenibacillus larvae]|uniref:Uncharacterized protein n=3 Tax=Paenibacillus larvae TaxID=1464 RepID=V9WBC5_9BACL|nr:hypothetical protein [Paenibacillus larvae]AQR78160.1 hypothetical protein BXP28_13320 [Paenibacillus larvae subsp. larvae]AQT85821.1 hypothetical protein B1222_17600 [Paenibacillus larvae subsp. pulvifaciens]ETK28383.1 hypothetical protein ERIC1_1c18450 [Paenibacillus larvae subsp. larvae DSM 25719]AHD07179.1 hypothetical protein ERIC2_c34470 [Paenibacillus larvae subsp. larvae DSM 25430]AQZ45953.1 hypothetical protein B5S25_04375 [Paenibacillus larvae subsp. pulvifaciens]
MQATILWSQDLKSAVKSLKSGLKQESLILTSMEQQSITKAFAQNSGINERKGVRPPGSWY